MRAATLRFATFLAAALDAAAEPIAYWPSGNTACPCINPWSRDLHLGSHQPPVSYAGCDIVRTLDGHCFSSSYGSNGCAAYDRTAAPECLVLQHQRPDWCSSMWCYVDANNCHRRSYPSTHFSNVSILVNSSITDCDAPDHQSLTLSYETCGYLDTFSVSEAGVSSELNAFARRNPNGKLRIGFPGDSASGYTIGACSRVARLRVPLEYRDPCSQLALS